jgi:inward rectifier potassium channel
LRRIVDLKLVREHHPLFVLGWNLMHVIDESSPIANASPESLAGVNAVFSLTLSGTDETTGQVLMGRAEYPSGAIKWNHTFRDVLGPDPDGMLVYDYRRFHDVVPVDPPEPV